MATTNEIVYDILELTKGHKLSDDIDVSEANIIYHLNNQRSLWLHNNFSKPFQTIAPELIQNIPCIDLKLVDQAECCTISSGCKFLRSKEPVPTPVFIKNKPAILRVGSPQLMKVGFNIVGHQQALHYSFSKFTGNDIFVFYMNSYIYLYSKNPENMLIDKISLRGVFENPLELEKYKCESGPCFSKDDKYPLSPRFIPYIKEQILKQLGFGMQVPKDTTNNAKEDGLQEGQTRRKV